VERNNGDFNVGDLEFHTKDSLLQQELKKEGVTDLEVECRVGDQTRWDFDDNLYDEMHLDG